MKYFRKLNTKKLFYLIFKQRSNIIICSYIYSPFNSNGMDIKDNYLCFSFFYIKLIVQNNTIV